MGEQVVVRRTGNSLIIVIPAAICRMYDIGEGDELELEPYTRDTLQLKL